MQKRCQLLDTVKRDLDINKQISPSTLANVEAIFGGEMVGLFADWKGASPFLMVNYALHRKMELYGPLDGRPQTKLELTEQLEELRTAVKEVDEQVQQARERAEEEVRMQAQEKILALFRKQLLIAQQEAEAPTAAVASVELGRLDLAIRYSTAATRALQRAIDHFFALKANRSR